MSGKPPAHEPLMSPQDALARVPGWSGDYSCRKISGGLTNRSWCVSSAAGEFVLRLDAAHTAALELDRGTELKILREASKVGIAPEIVWSDPPAGILLYKYLPGPVWQRESLDQPHNLERLAELLRKVHSLPAAGVPLDAVAAASRLAAAAGKDPALTPFAERCLCLVTELPAVEAVCCCHNDVIAANIVESSTICLLDWEYACDNDALFDLASLIGYHDLKKAQVSRLLDAYADGQVAEARERLEIQLRLFDCLQWLWFAAHESLLASDQHRRRLAELQQRISQSCGGSTRHS
ncbi:MAG: choline/ethanolamine kinase family protein [Woeseia sp.]